MRMPAPVEMTQAHPAMMPAPEVMTPVRPEMTPVAETSPPIAGSILASKASTAT
jgi:hypothetical protein